MVSTCSTNGDIFFLTYRAFIDSSGLTSSFWGRDCYYVENGNQAFSYNFWHIRSHLLYILSMPVPMKTAILWLLTRKPLFQIDFVVGDFHIASLFVRFSRYDLIALLRFMEYAHPELVTSDQIRGYFFMVAVRTLFSYFFFLKTVNLQRAYRP